VAQAAVAAEEYERRSLCNPFQSRRCHPCCPAHRPARHTVRGRASQVILAVAGAAAAGWILCGEACLTHAVGYHRVVVQHDVATVIAANRRRRRGRRLKGRRRRGRQRGHRRWAFWERRRQRERRGQWQRIRGRRRSWRRLLTNDGANRESKGEAHQRCHGIGWRPVRPVGMFRVLGMSQLTRLCVGFRCVCGCMHGCKDRE
jgi:hypothetical protein